MSRSRDLEKIAQLKTHSPALKMHVRKRLEGFSAQRLKRLRKKLEANRQPPIRINGAHRAERDWLDEHAPGIDLEGEG